MKPKLKFNLRLSIGLLVAGLGALALAAAVLSHGMLYLVTRHSASEANDQSARMAAESTALNISNLLNLLGQSLNTQAGDAKLAAVLSQADPDALKEAEERLTLAVPYAWLVRLLPENTDLPDESRAPRMGFADVDMLKEALTQAPPAALQLAGSPNAHLAMARRLAAGGGVIHASWPTKMFDTVVTNEGACGVELRQGNTSLAYRGEPGCKDKEPTGERPVGGTAWTILYWARPEVPANTAWFAATLGASVALIVGFTGLLIYLLSASLRHDRKSLLTQIDDLQSGKPLLNYPMRLSEFASLSEDIFRIKRATREAPPVEAPAPARFAMNIAAAPEPAAGEDFDEEAALAAYADDGLGQLDGTGIFHACDIRGVVGVDITEDSMYALGLAIGSEMEAQGEKYIALGRDGRLSSATLYKPLAQGLLDSGRMVVNLGQVPTPLVYYATHATTAKSGVMLTGGSNPPNHNGLKIVIGGEDLAEGRIQALRRRVENSDFVSGSGKMENYNLVPEYIERVLNDTQLGRDMKVVVDCGNGVASLAAPSLLRALGCEVVELFCDVDGNFPNHPPEPGNPENLQALIGKVLETRADLGVAFDSDGDRLGLVDSSGKVIWPDRLMMMFAADVLSREPGADIIYDVRSSRHLPSHIVKNGGRPLLCKSGHGLVKAKMKESGAMLAGEMSGHIYFQERWHGFDDAVYACARLIEILSIMDETSAEAFAKLPEGVSTPELSVAMAEGENFMLMEDLRTAANFSDARVTDIDGLRVDFLDGWGLVRASSTLPVLTFRFEADTEKSLLHIQRQFEDLLRRIKPELDLPF